MCLPAEWMVHAGFFFFLIPHKLLADGDVPEVAEFKVNRDGHKSIKHVYLVSL